MEFYHGATPHVDPVRDQPNFQLVIFTLDETVFSRRFAPLAGFYPSVYVGAPWWFLGRA
jgi:glucuronate isomerase